MADKPMKMDLREECRRYGFKPSEEKLWKLRYLILEVVEYSPDTETPNILDLEKIGADNSIEPRKVQRMIREIISDESSLIAYRRRLKKEREEARKAEITETRRRYSYGVVPYMAPFMGQFVSHY
jgi:hypothetical protein